MNKKLLYELIFAALALFAVSLAFVDILNKIPYEYKTIYIITDRVILIIFAIDYFTRLYLAKDKKTYIKDNVFELLSIIPLDSVFRGFRIFRIIRIIRILFLTKRLSGRFFLFLKTNGFIYVLIITICTVIIGATAIYYLEHQISMKSFEDALWWSFVTVTTVGYGDLSPATGAGRIVAAILMLVGIGFIGMLTGTIATFFLSKKSKSSIKNEEQFLDLSDLEYDKYIQVKDYCEYIRKK
ncbi:MAG TPA: ion channel [Patescibacteria group bacterium]|nr:ion channel [Patescibacteria group bacterium]